jgi:hypothetical protein
MQSQDNNINLFLINNVLDEIHDLENPEDRFYTPW